MRATRHTTTAKLFRIAVVLLILCLPACSGKSGGETAPPQAGRGTSSHPAQTDEAEPAQTPGSGAAEAVGGEDLFDRKIIKSAQLGLWADDVRDTAARAQQVADRFDGSVQSSRITGDKDNVSADLVLSVPSPEFEEALDALRGLGEKVTTDTVGGEDVTEEFVDLESRERNLLAAEASLLELYDRAESVEDALAIERELTNIRGQIEQVQGRIQYLERRTDLSEIVLNIRPVVKPTSPPAWDPLRVAARAWSGSLDVLQALASAAITAVVFGWWLAPVLVVAGLLLLRRRRERSDPPAPDSP